MLMDLLSSNNTIVVNCTYINVFGLNEAVYLSELFNYYKKAQENKEIDNNGFIEIDREAIKKRTTLGIQTQEKIDKQLNKLTLLKVKEKNKINLDFNKLVSLCLDQSESLLKETKLLSKSVKQTKEERIISQVKTHIKTTNEELYSAYSQWIDSVRAKQGWISSVAVDEAQKVVDNFSLMPDGSHNLDLALQLIKIASINGYRDMQWAVNTYARDYHNNNSYRLPNNNFSAPNNTNNQDKLELSDEIY